MNAKQAKKFRDLLDELAASAQAIGYNKGKIETPRLKADEIAAYESRINDEMNLLIDLRGKFYALIGIDDGVPEYDDAPNPT